MLKKNFFELLIIFLSVWFALETAEFVITPLVAKVLSDFEKFKVLFKNSKYTDLANLKIKELPKTTYLIVKKQCKTFEEAVDSSGEALERLLLKRKEKIRTHI